MKQKIISAIIAILIVIVVMILGGYYYKISVMALGVIGLFEIIKAKSKVKKIPLTIKILIVFNFVVMLLINIFSNEFILNMPYKYLILNALSLLMPLILYHDDKIYNVEDALFFFGIVTFLSLGFNALMMMRDYNVYYLIFIIILTTTTDTFAYAVGVLIGKHKLCPTISPNKTVEGFIGGLVFGTSITTSMYVVAFDYSDNIFLLILIIMLLSIMSTLGDLFFSVIKRHYNIKDLGKIMPGHGGILDRLDSILFVILTFCLIISII